MGTISVEVDAEDVLDELTTKQLVGEIVHRMDSRNGFSDQDRNDCARLIEKLPGLPGNYSTVRELADAIAEGDQKRALSLLHDLRPDLPPVRAITSLACGRAH